jgi:hypothetical protein
MRSRRSTSAGRRPDEIEVADMPKPMRMNVHSH